MKDKFEVVRFIVQEFYHPTRLLKRDDPTIIRFLEIDDCRIAVLLEKAIKKYNERMGKNVK